MSDYIPAELIPNILARLPSEDAIRCTSVCKSWYDLITSCDFISSHLKLSNPNQERRLLVEHISEAKQQFYNLYRDNQTCDKIADLDCMQITCMEEQFRMVDSFNGILYLNEFRRPDAIPAKILLWNPSIRKLFTLPKPKIIYPNPGIGFSYIPETNDYKIVRVSGDDPGDYHQDHQYPFVGVEIYELSKNSWHFVDVRGFSYAPWSGLLEGFFNGSLHWVAEDNYADFSNLIISLDMKNEKFGILMIPSCLNKFIMCLGTLKESFCAVQYTDFSYNIWVMNEYGVTESWAMQFKIDKKEHGLSRPIYVRDNGQVVFTNIHGYLVSYDSRSNQVTNIGGCEKNVDPYVGCYMESLVWIKIPKQIRKKAKLKKKAKLR